jgi:hypothetical protein
MSDEEGLIGDSISGEKENGEEGVALEGERGRGERWTDRTAAERTRVASVLRGRSLVREIKARSRESGEETNVRSFAGGDDADEDADEGRGDPRANRVALTTFPLHRFLTIPSAPPWTLPTTSLSSAKQAISTRSFWVRSS